MEKTKQFCVNIDQVWSEDVYVQAKDAQEAKIKAWNKWKSSPKPQKNYTIVAKKVI